MIARIWTTGVRSDRIEDYERFARTISLPMFKQQPGCEAVLMYREGAICRVLTLWRSHADVEALERSPSYAATVARIDAQGFLTGDQETKVYDSHLRWSDAALS